VKKALSCNPDHVQALSLQERLKNRAR